jgi:Immunoglobulin-like domain of bacterial spore germination
LTAPHHPNARAGTIVYANVKPRVQKTLRRGAISAASVALIFLTGCGGSKDEVDVCANADGALSSAGLIFVKAPPSGERVSSGFRVTGCSSTFEATVNWRLRGRDGATLASGVTQGGSIEPSSFEFSIDYSIGARQIGELEVFEPRVTEEGFPPSKDVVPVVLEP